MKPNYRHYFAIVVLLTLSIAGCNHHNIDNSATMTESELLAAANRLDSSFLAAFNAGDVNAFMENYWNSPELKAYPPARIMELKGYAAVKDFYTKDFLSNKGARLEYSNNSNAVFKDVVVGHGTFKWTMDVGAPAPLVLEARHTVVKAIKDGKMLIIVDHASAPMMMDASADTTETK